MTDLPNPLSHAYLLTGGSGESRAALIQRMESRNGILTVKAAAELGLGTREYELVSL